MNEETQSIDLYLRKGTFLVIVAVCIVTGWTGCPDYVTVSCGTIACLYGSCLMNAVGTCIVNHCVTVYGYGYGSVCLCLPVCVYGICSCVQVRLARAFGVFVMCLLGRAKRAPILNLELARLYGLGGANVCLYVCLFAP